MPPSSLRASCRRGFAAASRSTGAQTVVIDSLNGYQAAMPEEQALVLHMHELLQYLNRQGASTFLTVAQHGLVGDMKAPVDVTYLADTVILLRYFEALGRVRRAISVIKKRTGAHEDTIREYRIDGRGITLGEPLIGFQGVLRGVPELVGERPSRCWRRRPNDARHLRTGADPGAAGPRRRGRRGDARRGRHCAAISSRDLRQLVAQLARRRRLRPGHRGGAGRIADLQRARRRGSTSSPNGPTFRSSC